jgi:hypothetical protein
MSIRLLVQCHLLISCTPTTSNLYFETSSATVLSEPALYRLLTFHVPNLISIFFRSGRLSKESVQVRGFVNVFVTSLFYYGEELLAPRPTPQREYHPLSAVRYCLVNIFAASLQTWRASPPSATWELGADVGVGSKGPVVTELTETTRSISSCNGDALYACTWCCCRLLQEVRVSLKECVPSQQAVEAHGVVSRRGSVGSQMAVRLSAFTRLKIPGTHFC